jgi:tetratricopeptide (TPR) repeat protein
MGVVLLRRNNPRDAAAYFNSALAQKPDYGPALLNLANVSQYHLNNRKLALQKYQEYLASNPRPANWDAVNTTMRELDRELNPPAAPPVNPPAPHPAPPAGVAKAQTNIAPKTVAVSAPRPEPPQKPTVVETEPAPPKPEVVNVPTQTAVPVANDTTPAPAAATAPAGSPKPPPSRSSDVLLTEPVVASPPLDSTSNSTEPSQPQKRGFFQKINPINLFHRDQKPADIPEPLPKSPAAPDDSTRIGQVAANPGPAPAPTPGPQPTPKPFTLTHYAYKSPSRPPVGDRAEAERLFAQGVAAYKDHRLKDALTDYRAAARADGSYFEAQFNVGLAAFELGEMPESLLAYEMALAINPRSFNARFNFSLALKKADYIQDAATELERLLVICPPDELAEHLAMAHLTLANLYAEQFHQPDAARPHYLKVLELDPRNSQATAIRYWLRDNS